MARTIAKRTTAGLAALATAGGLVLAATPAEAQNYSRGYSDSGRSLTNGTGDADGRARANDNGRLRVHSEAKGGDGTGPLSPATETTAKTHAKWGKRVQVAHGDYRVVIHYTNLQGTERDRGDSSSAEATRLSKVQFVNQTGGGNRTIKRTQQLPERESNRTTKLLISIPNGESGYLRITALLRAVAHATGGGSHATAGGHTDNVWVSVNRI